MRSAVESTDLQGGACYDLLPQVVDKIYMAGRNAMATATGRAICAQCPIQTACLADAIVEPPGYGMRGGEINASLWLLHERWMTDGIEADELAAEAISQQRQLRGSMDFYHLRRGRFVDAQLAFPEMGGES